VRREWSQLTIVEREQSRGSKRRPRRAGEATIRVLEFPAPATGVTSTPPLNVATAHKRAATKDQD
jgi:hypothetical protein